MLNPHPYLAKIKSYFKKQEAVWKFFSSRSKQDDYDEFNNSLLKNAYRMDVESEHALYKILDEAKSKLEITIPVTLYQLQGTSDLNAFISYQQTEAHLVFSGPVLKLLNEEETKALIAHELSHIKLYTIDDGDYEIANRIVTSIANDVRSETVFLETARYFRLYMEIFCDLGSLLVSDNEEITQLSLIKIHTGLENASAANYLSQAKEILLKNKDLKSEGDTHPENFIRVLALHYYKNSSLPADEDISNLIEYRYDMDKLDVFRQEKLALYTRYLMHEFTSVKWMQTDAVQAVCAQYFSDYATGRESAIDWNADIFNTNVKEYFGYVLLDMAMADPQLENVPIGRALSMAEELGFKDEFNSIVKKEYKISEKQLREMKTHAIHSAANLEN